MGHQNAHYLKLKGRTYYYSRRVPKGLHKFSQVPRIEVCLHTTARSSALRQSRILSAELEDQWTILRRRERNDRILKIFGGPLEPTAQALKSAANGPLMSEALETYLELKGAGRPQTFAAGARRSVGYLWEVSEDKPLDAYERSDANALREYLKGRGLAQDSIARNLTNVRAIINFVLRECGLQPSQAFSGVYLGEPSKKVKRYVPTEYELRKLQSLCRKKDDELRWLLALISDTGMRLSEAIGLCRSDVILDAPHPFVRIEPKPWRRLKTAESERIVPLVGAALWAVKMALAQSCNDYVFPKYCSSSEVKANSASAALNKWLKAKVSAEVVIHSLRHAFRDRLRAINCPPEIIDRLGGWARVGVGETYGEGYTTEVYHSYLKSIATQ